MGLWLEGMGTLVEPGGDRARREGPVISGESPTIDWDGHPESQGPAPFCLRVFATSRRVGSCYSSTPYVCTPISKNLHTPIRYGIGIRPKYAQVPAPDLGCPPLSDVHHLSKSNPEVQQRSPTPEIEYQGARQSTFFPRFLTLLYLISYRGVRGDGDNNGYGMAWHGVVWRVQMGIGRWCDR